MLTYVGAEGSSNAKLAIVGEAPGGEEERQQRPFVGPTGKIVEDCLNELGLRRDEVYLTNVVKIRPPGNNIDSLHVLGKNINDFIPQLQSELEALKPYSVLALGNTALTALTGYHGIEKYRGSILPCSLSATKVVPSLHPASLLHAEGDSSLRSWKDLTFIKWDFARAIEQSKFEEYRPPKRNLLICKSALDLHRFLQKYEDNLLVSVDIETFKTIPICIAFAFCSDEAMSVPLFFSTMTRSDQIECWRLVAELLANPNIFKIGQNFKFDEGRLISSPNCHIHTKECDNEKKNLFCHQKSTINFGFKTYSFWFDTMLAFRILYPELPSALQFTTSVLTEESYYKDEGKEYNPKRDKFDRLLLYNAKDAAVTYEVFERELEELNERNLTEFFFEKVMPLHPFYSRLEARGILRDEFQQKYLKEKYEDKQKELQKELDELIAPYWDFDIKPFNTNSNGARGDVPKLLYGLMHLPVRKGTDEKTLDALMRNAVKKPEQKRVLELILEIRKVRKTIGTYIDHETDNRGRTLTTVRIALETGRTSNGILKAPVTTEQMGLAFQTVTKHGDVGIDLRSMWVPDPGYVFIESDLSGAEARVVAILARDDKLLKIFKYNLDLHRITTGWIDGVCPDDLLEEFFNAQTEDLILDIKKKIVPILKTRISDEYRQVGKKFRHAGHYDMGKREAARQTGFSEWKSSQILAKFHSTNPNIRGVFHKEIQEALRDNNRVLISPHGRARQFLNRWGDELFKEAYADIPQATVSDHTKFSARVVEKRAPWCQIVVESHDSFTSLVPIEKTDEYRRITQEEMDRPIDFSKCSLPRGELVIPCEFKIGKKNWEEMEDF